MSGHEQKSPSYLPTERTYTLEEQVTTSIFPLSG